MNRYLRRNDGEIYGPVDLSTLQLWATDGRVAPDDKISEDQNTWTPACELAELAMEWKVELRDGSIYGPVHLLALRDMIHDGTVSPRAKIKHKQSGEEQVACEALLIALIKRESGAPLILSAPAPQLAEAEHKIEKLQQDLQKASGVENKLRDEIKNLAAKQKIIVPPAGASPAEVRNLREEVAKWKKLYEEEQSAAATREAELKRQIHEQKSEGDERGKLVKEAEKWKELHAQAVAEMEQVKKGQTNDQRAQIRTLREEFGKWKKIHEEEQSAAAAREAELTRRIREQESGDDGQRGLVQEVEKWKELHAQAVAEMEQVKSRNAADQQAQVQDLREQIDKLRKLYEEERSAAATREAELKQRVRGQKTVSDQHNALVQEVEKWKKMHAHAAAEVEQMKSRRVVEQPAGGDMVPRARLEDAERKLAQTERNYQQLLKTLNRSFGARGGGRPPPQADNLQRRDVS